MCEQLKIAPVEVAHVGPFTTAAELERWYAERLEQRGLVTVTKKTLEYLIGHQRPLEAEKEE